MKILWTAVLFAALTLMAAPQQSAHHSGKVVETMNAGGYTYMKVDENGEKYWVAVTEIVVRKGETVSFEEQMWMQNFPSRSLERTFEKILFATLSSPSAAPAEAVRPKTAPTTPVARAEGGSRIAELFAARGTLDGKSVKVRGVVTKVSRQIMKRNWVHLQDGSGSGSAGNDDLVFTTRDDVTLRPGETVIAEGTATVDKDFGYGYFYPVIIEESRFTPER